MSGRRLGMFRDGRRLLWLAVLRLAGRRFWILPILTLLWPAFWWFTLAVGWRAEEFSGASVVPFLLGLPVSVLGIGLGVRIIAGEIEQRTIEIAYTVPGGASRLWAYKLFAATLIIASAIALSALFIFLFMAAYDWEVLLGSFTAAMFHLTLSMWMAALTRSEVTGALIGAPVLFMSLMLSETRVSPLFNPAGLVGGEQAYAASEVLAWTVQNRIGVLLAIGALIFLAFGRAEQREQVLGG